MAKRGVRNGPPLQSNRSSLARVMPAHPVAAGFAVATGVILAVAVAAALVSISTVIASVVLALFLALGLDPAVRALQRRSLSRRVAVVVVAASAVVLVLGVVLIIVPVAVRQLGAVVQGAPEAVAALATSEWFVHLEASLDIDVEVLLMDALRSVADLSSLIFVSGGLLRAGFGVVGAVSSVFIVVVLTLYFVASLRAIKRTVALFAPAYSREGFSWILERIAQSVGGVVAGAVTLSTINALVVFAIQLLIGSSVPALMAIGAFFVTLVPLIGSMVFLAVGSVGALFISPSAALAFALAYFVYIQLEAYFITPRVMGRAVAVPSVLVIIGALAGAALFGLLGALVAIPVTASVLIIVREVIIPRQDRRLRPPDDFGTEA